MCQSNAATQVLLPETRSKYVPVCSSANVLGNCSCIALPPASLQSCSRRSQGAVPTSRLELVDSNRIHSTQATIWVVIAWLRPLSRLFPCLTFSRLEVIDSNRIQSAQAGMWVVSAETFKNRDVFGEPTRMYSWRVSADTTRSAADVWQLPYRSPTLYPGDRPVQLFTKSR